MRNDFAKLIEIIEKQFGIEPVLTAKLAKSNAKISKF
jgi:hypothetical protein